MFNKQKLVRCSLYRYFHNYPVCQRHSLWKFGAYMNRGAKQHIFTIAQEEDFHLFIKFYVTVLCRKWHFLSWKWMGAYCFRSVCQSFFFIFPLLFFILGTVFLYGWSTSKCQTSTLTTLTHFYLFQIKWIIHCISHSIIP